MPTYIATVSRSKLVSKLVSRDGTTEAIPARGKRRTADPVREQVARVVERRAVHERQGLLRADSERVAARLGRMRNGGQFAVRRCARGGPVVRRVGVFGPPRRERVQVVVGRDGWRRAVRVRVVLQELGVDKLDRKVGRVDVLRHRRIDRSEVVGQGGYPRRYAEESASRNSLTRANLEGKSSANAPVSPSYMTRPPASNRRRSKSEKVSKFGWWIVQTTSTFCSLARRRTDGCAQASSQRKESRSGNTALTEGDDLLARRGVESTGRFVQDEDARLGDDRTRDRDAALLPSRDAALQRGTDPVVRDRCEPKRLQRRVDVVGNVGVRRAESVVVHKGSTDYPPATRRRRDANSTATRRDGKASVDSRQVCGKRDGLFDGQHAEEGVVLLDKREQLAG